MIIMKKMIRQLSIFFFCMLMLMTSVLRVKADENEYEDGTIELNATYYVMTSQHDNTLKVPFNARWFDADAHIYNHDLAKLSLGFAVASFRPSNKYSDPNRSADASAISFLDQAGFVEMQSDDYDKNPSIYTVSTVMGHQKIGEGDDAFELIAIGVCGQGYLDEWESNFSILGDDYENEELHDGFQRSSRLIYDRVFGYISSHHLSGPIKVWITGFSRAAAVSNITAAWLSDSDLLGESNVFAYTFATPRTTRDPKSGQYQNIYNIVGKTDPVPLVPFADWGYDRYGVTYSTPSLETDSDFQEKRLKANAVYKEITGIDYWVNPDMDKHIRNILDYFLKIVPDAKTYRLALQDELIHLWADRSPINILARILSIASEPLLMDKDVRHEANSLLNYMTYLLIDSATNRNAQRKWKKEASLSSNMAQAHTPELYISWVFSADRGENLYSEQDTFQYIYLDHSNGSLAVELYRDGQLVEKIDDLDPSSLDQNVYLLQSDDGITAQIPNDKEYQLDVTAYSDEIILMGLTNAAYRVGHHSPEHTIRNYYFLDDEDTISMTLTTDGQVLSSKPEDSSAVIIYESDEYLDTSTVIAAERHNMLNLTWRTIMMLVIAAVIIAVSILMYQIVWLVTRFRFNWLKKIGWIKPDEKFHSLPLFCFFFMFSLFVIEEFFAVLYPEDLLIHLVFKGLIGLLSVLVAWIGYKNHKTKLNMMIVISLAALCIADVTTRVNLRIGTIFHMSCYGLLVYAYCQVEKPDWQQYKIFIILAAVSFGVTMGLEGNFQADRLLAFGYLLSALYMVVCSFPLPRRCFAGSILLLLGGILLIATNVLRISTEFLPHLVSLGTYYAGIGTLASTGVRMPIARLVPVYDEETPPAEQPLPEQ